MNMKKILLTSLAISSTILSLLSAAAAGRDDIRHDIIRRYEGPGMPSTYRSAWEYVAKQKQGQRPAADEREAYGILYRTYHRQATPEAKAAFREVSLDHFNRDEDITFAQAKELFDDVEEGISYSA